MKIILVTNKGVRLPTISLGDFIMIMVLLFLFLTWISSAGLEGKKNSWNEIHITTMIFNGLTENNSNSDQQNDSPDKKNKSPDIISIYFEILTLLAILYALSRLFVILKAGVSIALKPFYNRPSNLFERKLFSEFKSFSLDSTSSFVDKNQQGQLIEKELEILSQHLKDKNNANALYKFNKTFYKLSPVRNKYEKKLKGLHVNKKIWGSNWNYWDTCELSDIRFYSTDENSFHKERADNLEKLKALCESVEVQNCKLNFYVANIQPSIIYSAEKIVNEIDPAKNRIEIITETHTGPHTISEAVKAKIRCKKKTFLQTIEAKIRNTETEQTEIICFVAPVAAFCTYQHSQFSSSEKINKLNPNDYFIPVTTVIEEDQEILFVEDYTRTPHRAAPKIYYYNNSTSEECIAKLDKNILNLYDLCEINEFDTYKHLLSETYTNGHSLEPGDGIALWAPLIENFIDKKVATGILKPHNQRSLYQKMSMINIYADKEITEKGDEKIKKFQLVFLRALILEMRFLQLKYINVGMVGKLPVEFLKSWCNSDINLLKKSHIHTFTRSIGR